MVSTSTTSGDPPVIPSEQLIKRMDYAVASGGYGQVFQCTMRPPAAPEILVAVKVLMRLTGDASKLKRARREMKLWMEAKHDNIVPMLGIAEEFSKTGFAMVSPWMKGGTLALYLQVHAGAIHSKKKLTLLKDTAKGLAYLHSRQIVHGDLTTNNIMLDDNDKALLIDFGLSNVLEGIDGSCLTPSPARPGAVRFAAPELLGVKEAISQPTGKTSPMHYQSPMPNKHSDIYSLGCVILNVLTEQLPWHRYPNMTFLGDLHAPKPIPIPAHGHLSNERKKLICECTSVQVNGRPSSQYVVDFIEEELHIEDTVAPIQESMPSQVASTSLQQPSADLFGQIHFRDDGITPTTIHSESSYSSCLTSLPDDSHDGASSQTRNVPTATQRPNLDVPVEVLITTEMPNNNDPPAINSPSRKSNIVVAGAIGSGKSSLVNILCGKHVAQTSNNAERCTRKLTDYQTSFRNIEYRVFDTLGFACSTGTSLGPKERPEKHEKLQIEEIHEQRSIDLLLLCVSSRNFHVQAVLDVHRRIQDQLHGRHVPIVLIFTHYEERSKIDSWWSKNLLTLQAQLNSIANHISITSIDDKCLDESRRHIFQIIAQHRTSDAGEPWQETPESEDVNSAPPLRSFLGDAARALRIKQFSTQVRGVVMSGFGLRPRSS
ncbi:kinase-like domain-containing protein [Suillus subalutaceus]|uniref:kinase-like domain-containing protein n=1 Tax=Suillus subalutaceus TaxID=48586 RepID=UPI001B882F98|nr:kinase-like domain-containing protein [Suillus subalutaceus]KAG1871233.1 kinase-like domain-containing protein [Suillus subalutaceus]